MHHRWIPLFIQPYRCLQRDCPLNNITSIYRSIKDGYCCRSLLTTAAELRGELSQTAIEHTKFLADHARRGADILHSVRGRYLGLLRVINCEVQHSTDSAVVPSVSSVW